MIITNSRYALVGYFITSYPTRAHGTIVICTKLGKTITEHKILRAIPLGLPGLIGKSRFIFSLLDPWSLADRYSIIESTNGVWPLP